MILQSKTLEKLRNLVNEETEYRKGHELVAFFNQLGFHDSYGQGFPSRWIYTDSKLTQINGTPEIDKCIKLVFAPVNFIGRFSELDKLINDFNQYLAFDGWEVVRKGTEVTFQKAGEIKFVDEKQTPKVEDFLEQEFADISLNKLGLEPELVKILESRIAEVKQCLSAKAALSVIFLSGSSLEGILLGLSIKFPADFNRAKASPKDSSGKVLDLTEWKLNGMIDVAYELG